MALIGACGTEEAEPGAEFPAVTADAGDGAESTAPLGDTSSPAEPAAVDTTTPLGSSPTAPTETDPPPLAPTTTSTPTDPDPSPPVTPSPTATPEPATAGWSPLDFDAVSPTAFPPCCGDTWHGEVSPAFAPDGQPLADGPYAVAMQWPDVPAASLELHVFRFDRCAVLPVSACEQPGIGVEFEPDQLGVDTADSRTIRVPLDDAVDAVVVGWATAEPADPSGPGFVIETATGVELAALALEVERAYAEVFAARLAAGEDPDAVVADVLASPTGRFGPGLGSFDAVVFTPTTGPPLLFQSVFPWVDGQRTVGRGTDVLPIRSLEMVVGRITLYVYGAYTP